MAFVFERLEKLHKMSGERAIDFSRDIFGPTSKLGLVYFKDKTSISTAHLEKLCLRYHVPMSYFFNGPVITDSQIENLITNNHVGVGNVNINNSIAHLQDVVEHQKKQIENKDVEIAWLRKQMEAVIQALGTRTADEEKK